MAIEHDELANLVPALVLGAVTAEERQRLLVHLEGCASCRVLAARLARGAAVLALEPDPVEPPARLHGRVLAAVAAARQDAPPPPRRRALSLPPRTRPPHLRVRGVPPGLVAAAAVAFVLGAGLGVGVGAGHGRVPFTQASPVPDAQVARYPLHGTGTMAGVSASAVSLKRDGVTLVDFQNMPPLPAEQVYQLWLITGDGSAQSLGVFMPNAQGSGVVVVTRQLTGGKELAVTVEQGPDGAAAPSRRPQLSGSIA